MHSPTSFLTDRRQVCKVHVNGHLSAINQSIVKGSGIGSQLYIVMKSDLKPLSNDNILLKYADDITLLVSEHFTVDIAVEFLHAEAWAGQQPINYVLTLKFKKTCCANPGPDLITCHCHLMTWTVLHPRNFLELFFRRISRWMCTLTLFLSQCNQRVYLLILLRSKGLPTVPYSWIKRIL